MFTMPADLDSGPQSLVFDERLVRCDPEAMRAGIERLGSSINQFPDLPTHLPDGDALHRYLLNWRRARGRSSGYWAAGQALKYVRQHSRVYGARSCWCLVQAWRTFEARVDEALQQTHTGDLEAWVSTNVPTGAPDIVGRAIELKSFGRHFGWSHDNLAHTITRTKAPYLELTIAPTVVTVDWGRSHANEAVRFERLTREAASLATVLRYATTAQGGPTPWGRAPGAWIQTWPPALVSAVLDWHVSHRGSQGPGEFASDLLSSGARDLSQDALRVVRALAGGWEASASELVATARAVASMDPAEPGR